jgi:hypothetical protein
MSDFCVFFPCQHSPQAPPPVPASFTELERILYDPLRADKVWSQVVHGSPVLLSTAFGKSPQFYARPDGAGWVVVKGIMVDTRSDTPAVNLEQLLDQILIEGPGDLNRYEGVYAVAAWDAHKGQGWAFNDQVSSLNLYYGEYDGGLYVSTISLALARALGLELDPFSVQEFLLRSCILVPGSMFAGLRRVEIGEHIHYRAGKLIQGVHWHVCDPQSRASRAHYRSVEKAAETTASLAVDRISRFSAIANPVINDLTGGLDSRLLSSAAEAAGLDVTVTVNGPPESEDVRISHKVAEAMDWDMRYFDIQSLWAEDIDPEMRRELVYRTNGELGFTEIYHHLLSRPTLGQQYGLHMIGIGGEFARTFPMEEAFKMRYGSLVVGTPPADLFTFDSYTDFYTRFQKRLKAHSCRENGASMTQQLDAAFIWKMTSHASQYLSAVHNWLPSVAPMLGAEVVQTATAMPTRWRLGSQLQRQIIACLSPRASQIESFHSARQELRGTAQPGPKTVAVETLRYGKRLAKAFERRALKGVFSKRSSTKTITLVTQGRVPLFTSEFRRFLDPRTMYSRALYAPDGLQRVLSGDDAEWSSKVFLIVRLAQMEQLCRELDVRPEPDFWAPVLTARAA